MILASDKAPKRGGDKRSQAAKSKVMGMTNDVVDPNANKSSRIVAREVGIGINQAERYDWLASKRADLAREVLAGALALKLAYDQGRAAERDANEAAGALMRMATWSAQV